MCVYMLMLLKYLICFVTVVCPKAGKLQLRSVSWCFNWGGSPFVDSLFNQLSGCEHSISCCSHVSRLWKMWYFCTWLFPQVWLHASHAVSFLSECKSVCVFTYIFFKISSPRGEAVLQRKVSLWLKWCLGVLVGWRIKRLICRCVTNGTVTLDCKLVGSFCRPFWKGKSLPHN